MARAHHTTLPQDEARDTSGPVESIVPKTESRRGTAETWLLVGGILMMLAGVALVALPTVLPQYGWIVRSLASRGVASLPIAIGGVLLVGIAFAGRSGRGGSAEAFDASRETSPAIEELSQQVAHLGDGLQGIRIEFVYLKDALQSQIDRVQSTTNTDNAGDAVYRLAASLDQVGMRIEERFNAGHRDLGEALQALTTSLEGLREEHVRIRARLDELRAPEAEQRTYSIDASEDSYDTAWETGNGERASRLGLLDMLDDLGRLLPRKSEPIDAHVEIETDLFADAQDEGWKQSASIPAPLPSPRGDELRIAEPAGPAARGHARSHGPAEPLGNKLEELRGLLADSRVREALAALEKARR